MDISDARQQFETLDAALSAIEDEILVLSSDEDDTDSGGERILEPDLESRKQTRQLLVAKKREAYLQLAEIVCEGLEQVPLKTTIFEAQRACSRAVVNVVTAHVRRLSREIARRNDEVDYLVRSSHGLGFDDERQGLARLWSDATLLASEQAHGHRGILIGECEVAYADTGNAIAELFISIESALAALGVELNDQLASR